MSLISFDEFVKRWSGKPVDFDGIYPNQCMDLMHYYVYEVLGIKDKAVLAAPAAKDVYLKFKWDKFFTKIDNTPEGLPKKGDIMFFSTGKYGHVSIFLDGDLKKFNSFDANFPVGSLPHIQSHTYTGVLGWLRVKANVDPCEEKASALNEEIITLQTLLDKSNNSLKEETNKYLDEITKKDDHIKSIQDTLSEMNLSMINLNNHNNKLIQDLENFEKLKEEVKLKDSAITGKDQVITDLSLKLEQKVTDFSTHIIVVELLRRCYPWKK